MMEKGAWGKTAGLNQVAQHQFCRKLEALGQCIAPSYQYRDTNPDPDHHQNLIICSLSHCQPSLKISCKSVWTFLREVANRQTDKQTNRQTNKQRRLHNLLGGGN